MKTKVRACLWAAVVLCVAVCLGTFWRGVVVAGSMSAVSYTFTAVNYPGALSTEGHGINDKGVLVGRYWDGQKNHGFVKTPAGFTTIDFQGNDTALYGINSANDITGIYFTPDGPPFGHGFLYHGGQFVNVSFPGSDVTVPYGISDSGEIVGSYDQAPNFTSRAFSLLKGAYTAIDFPGAASTEGYGLNKAGKIVGVATLNPTGTPCCSGYLYMDGHFTKFDFPGGATATYAHGINRHGHIAGWYTDANFNAHGFVKSDENFVSIDYPGASSTTVEGLNDTGQLVGYYTGGDCAAAPGFTCGFVATP